jgi:hypothetical protein
MKSYFFLLIAIICLNVNAQDEIPRLKIASYSDRSLIPLSFRSMQVDCVRLTNSKGDSCLNYQIISGIVESMDSGQKEIIAENGFLSETAKHLIRSTKPGLFKISVYYKNIRTEEKGESQMMFSLGISPEIVFGNITNGDSLVDRNSILSISQIFMGFSHIPEANDFFRIKSGTLTAEGSEMTGLILEGGHLDQTCLAILQNPDSKNITLNINWVDGNNIGRKSSFWFKINA